MKVAELWRYPVKSLRGERLERTDVLADGFRGDRLTQVVDHTGARITGRTAKGLLGLQAGLGPNGEPTVDGHPWEAEEALGLIRGAAGPGAGLTSLGRHFDAEPILVITDGTVGALGEDLRRMRPNIVLEGVESLAETSWIGRRIRARQVELEVVDLCERCVMTTIDPDTLDLRPDVLRRINADFDRMMGVLCRVSVAGEIAVGEPAEVA